MRDDTPSAGFCQGMNGSGAGDPRGKGSNPGRPSMPPVNCLTNEHCPVVYIEKAPFRGSLIPDRERYAMKPGWKIFVTLSAVAAIVGFMLPWICVDLKAFMLNITGFDFLRILAWADGAGKLGPVEIMVNSLDFPKELFVLAPALGILTLSVNSLRGPAMFYFIAAVIVLGCFIYGFIGLYTALRDVFQALDASKSVLKQLNIPGVKVEVGLDLFGSGLFVTLGGVLGVLIGGYREIVYVKHH